MSELRISPVPVPVAIVGAGPVGLSLALGLARHGVRSVVFERSDATSRYSKAPGIHIRTREIFRAWGVERDLLGAGTLVDRITLHDADPGGSAFMSLPFGELADEAERPAVLILEQGETERILLEAVRSTGVCDVRFSERVTGLSQGDRGVTLEVETDDGSRTVEAAYVVGCDGASSMVRHALGMSFDGITYALRPMLADVRIDDDRDALPSPRVRNDPGAYMFALRLSAGLWRIVRLDREDPDREEVADDEVRRHVDRLLGPGPSLHGPGPEEVVWGSRFRIHRRHAPRFRMGRVLLAGDAAHVHSPVGGMGLNAGVQDAHNLAWKLAAVLEGGDVDRLLDSYDVERRAVVVGNVSPFTDVVTRLFLQSPAAVRSSLFAVVRAFLRVPSVRRRSLRRASMLDLPYPASSPILERNDRAAGVRLPDVRLRANDGTEVRLYAALPRGAALIEVVGAARWGAAAGDVVRIGDRGYVDPTGTLRSLVGRDHGWVLVRPDRHVAWARQQPPVDTAKAFAHAPVPLAA